MFKLSCDSGFRSVEVVLVCSQLLCLELSFSFISCAKLHLPSVLSLFVSSYIVPSRYGQKLSGNLFLQSPRFFYFLLSIQISENDTSTLRMSKLDLQCAIADRGGNPNIIKENHNTKPDSRSLSFRNSIGVKNMKLMRETYAAHSYSTAEVELKPQSKDQYFYSKA